MTKEKILVVEDDEDLSFIVKTQLEKGGFEVVCAMDFREIREEINLYEIDLIILDMNLPDGNGIEVCTYIREYTVCPIIFVSCIGERDTIISALAQGGDDYIVKPVDTEELMARIDANLRRVRKYEGSQIKDKKELFFKQFSVEKASHTVWRIGESGEKLEKTSLSPIEYKLLLLFIENEGQLLLYEEMYQYVWETDALDDVRTVMVHVSNLRKKINWRQTDMIHTVRGAGYIFSDL